MKINIHCKKKSEENKYIQSFINFYLSSYYSEKFEKIDLECLDEKQKTKPSPDYFLTQLKIAIEIKRVFDTNEVYRAKTTHVNVKRIQKELDELVKKETELKGSYYLQYPWFLKIKRGKEKEIAQKIINELKNDVQEITIEKVGIFKVISLNLPKQQKTQVLLVGSISPIVSINAPQTIYQNIRDKIARANKQLNIKKANKKILLLINKYLWGERPEYFFEALSYCYPKLLNYKNIDEIWLQTKSATENFSHILLYKRDFFYSFEKGKFKSIIQDNNNIKLFENWFYPLSKLGREYKEKLFFALKQFLKNKKPSEIFENKFVREEMVWFGIWLAEKNRFNDVIWIIDKFIDDPDPEDPEKYSGDQKFNYHQQIIEGKDPGIITTVLGHLAWVIQRIATQKDYISKALDYTKKLLSHKNLYVKLQAIIPLIEIAAKRQWLKGWGERPRKGEYKKFHDLVFSLVKIVKENPNYKAIGRWLCSVFEYYKDLSTKEVEEVLDTLKITEESASLFVYFSIFRQEHYKNQPIQYDGKKIEEKLKEMIKSNEYKHQHLKEKIIFYLWKILEIDRKKIDIVKPYIDLVLKQPCNLDLPYQNAIYNHIERIIRDWVKERPEVCIQWYKQMLSNIISFSKRRKILRLILLYTKEILENIEKINPQELAEIEKRLSFLKNKGAFMEPAVKKRLK